MCGRDDNFVAKEDLESIKFKLLSILKGEEIPEPLKRLNLHPAEFSNPSNYLDGIIGILHKIRDVFRRNFTKLDVDSIMPRWCCAESPVLFRERWEKLFKEFCDVDRNVFDPSKISELYDSLKYDAL